MYQNFIIPYLYEAQHVSDDTPSIIRCLKLHRQPLIFHTWKVNRRVVRGLCQAHCAWQSPQSPSIKVKFIKKNPTRCSNVSKFYHSIFIWNSTCYGRHTAHHQEPKTVVPASGFLYVEGCSTCSWWTLSGTLCLTTSTNCGRSPAEILGSNPTGGMDICLLWVSCVVR